MDDPKPVTVRASQPERSARIARLVSEAQRGSEDALGEIVTEFSPMLWHIARAAGLSTGDAEDVEGRGRNSH